MKKQLFLILFFLLFVMISCDNFNLLEQYGNLPDQNNSNGGLILNPQKTTLVQGETIDLNPVGGTQPYTISVIANVLYYSNGSDYGFVTGESYTAGDAVGSVFILLTDQDNYSVQVELTIIPLSPANFIADGSAPTGPTEIVFSWDSYGTPSHISGFTIEMSTGSSYSLLTSAPGGNDTTFSSSSFSPNTDYSFRIFAVAGSIRSQSSPVSNTTSNP